MLVKRNFGKKVRSNKQIEVIKPDYETRKSNSKINCFKNNDVINSTSKEIILKSNIHNEILAEKAKKRVIYNQMFGHNEAIIEVEPGCEC